MTFANIWIQWILRNTGNHQVENRVLLNILSFYIYYNLYFISNLWRVKRNELLLKLIKNQYKYICVNLSRYWKVKRFAVHRLVAQAFLWLDISDTKMFVCHIDDNPSNNRADNLFLWTHTENMHDMINKWRRSSRNTLKKVLQFTKQWEFIKEWNSVTEASKRNWISQSNISSCCTGKIKSSWWYKWNFNK